MGSLHRFNLAAIRSDLGLTTLVETGTGGGRSLACAVRAGFETLFSTESHKPLYDAALEQFAEFRQVKLFNMDSPAFLNKHVQTSNAGRLIFLDAHFDGGADFGLANYNESAKDPRSFPLLEELTVLKGRLNVSDLIIIDDARLYLSGPFQLGECPEFARRWHELEALKEILESFSDTHSVMRLSSDHGYILLVPSAYRSRVASWVYMLPTDPNPNKLQLRSNVPGVTSISMLRRVQDSRFATRYFKGYGLDVGGGTDSLALFREFFPLIKNLIVYEREQGDGQLLANLPADSFDFVFSSHCLEHLRDPEEAVRNWLRVLKPGGYLVVQVPDEDLYEQGVWPSRFNTDHKLTFTIGKQASWSPVSVNVMDLLAKFRANAKTHSVQLLDQGYRYSLQGKNIDQTRFPMAECGIEFVLQKT